MPETEVDTVTREWLQGQLRAAADNVIVLDCRSTNEFAEGHIRLALNFSIPSIMLRRLAAGKIALTSTIKCRELKRRIENAYRDSVFVLYTAESVVGQQQQQQPSNAAAQSPSDSVGGVGDSMLGIVGGGGSCSSNGSAGDATIINVLHRRLKQDGCRVYLLEGKAFSSSRHMFYTEYLHMHAYARSATAPEQRGTTALHTKRRCCAARFKREHSRAHRQRIVRLCVATTVASQQHTNNNSSSSQPPS